MFAISNCYQPLVFVGIILAIVVYLQENIKSKIDIKISTTFIFMYELNDFYF